MHYLVSEATPDHHVLRLNLRAHLGHREPTRLPYGLRHRHPRLGLGHPCFQRPFRGGDRPYGRSLGQGSPKKAARQAPDLAHQSLLVFGRVPRTRRPHRGRGPLERPHGRPCPEFGYVPAWYRDLLCLLRRPRQCAGRGDRMAGVRTAPSAEPNERPECRPPHRADLGFVAPTAVADRRTWSHSHSLHWFLGLGLRTEHHLHLGVQQHRGSLLMIVLLHATVNLPLTLVRDDL